MSKHSHWLGHYYLDRIAIRPYFRVCTLHNYVKVHIAWILQILLGKISYLPRSHSLGACLNSTNTMQYGRHWSLTLLLLLLSCAFVFTYKLHEILKWVNTLSPIATLAMDNICHFCFDMQNLWNSTKEYCTHIMHNIYWSSTRVPHSWIFYEGVLNSLFAQTET